jgi:phytanoyl-CoA hydroxylase
VTCEYHFSLPREQIDEYHRHGFLVVRDIIPAEVIARGWALYDTWLDDIVAQWQETGELAEDLSAESAPERFYEAWKKAGRPKFRRRPFKYLISEPAFRFLRERVFLDLASQLLGTGEIRMHGVYNGRAQPPDSEWATPPFHQDAQFWDSSVGIDDTDPDVHVLTMWFPLHHVDENAGGLQMISLQDCGDMIFERAKVNYDETGYVGMRPEIAEQFPHHKISMEAGDILLFNQKAPHQASLNHADRVRFSYDLRYEAIESDTAVGRKYGFIARSLRDPSLETTMADWVRKRDLYLEWFGETKGRK